MKQSASKPARVVVALVMALMAAGVVGRRQADASADRADVSTLDFGQPSQWAGGARPLPRESDTQLMMVDLLSIEVPGVSARAEPRQPSSGGFFAQVWSGLARGLLEPLAAYSSSARSAIWLDPLGGGLGGGGGQGVTRATRVHAYLTSLGNSTGEAFDIEIVNDGANPIRLDGDGVVVQPIKAGADKTVRAELQRVSNSRSGIATSRANAYCLEFKLKPPERGNMFEVSDAATQQKYAPAREILRASRRLQAAGQLTPDSDPTDYFHSIRQWAIWVNEQKFTLAGYRAAFIERTRKNVEAMRRQWSKDLENALTGYVPHRWDEITKILHAANQPVPGGP